MKGERNDDERLDLQGTQTEMASFGNDNISEYYAVYKSYDL
jgi:hypothetical protein